MERGTLDHNAIEKFRRFLINEERSEATVEKYLRDVKRFYSFSKDREIDKTTVMEYKAELGRGFAVASANSMIAEYLKQFDGDAQAAAKELEREYTVDNELCLFSKK